MMAVKDDVDRGAFYTQIFQARDEFFWRFFGKTLYPTQRKISNAIIYNMVENSGPKEHTCDDVAAQLPRQYGKSMDIGGTVAFVAAHLREMWTVLMGPDFVENFYRRYWEDGYCIDIFTPQFEQNLALYSKLKMIFQRAENEGYKDIKLTESNRNCLRLSIHGRPNAVSIFTFTLNLTSNPKSKTGHVLIFDESQDIIDQIREEKALPMGTDTNATRIDIGTAGYSECDFHRRIEIDKPRFHYAIDCWEAIKERQKAFDEDGDILHLNYEKFVKKQQKKFHAREFGTQYEGKWALDVGMLFTLSTIKQWFANGLERGLKRVLASDKPVSIGIDWGKELDSTCVYVVNDNTEAGALDILNIFEYEGFDYETQWECIAEDIRGYTRILSMNADSTGTQSGTIAGLRRVLRDKGLPAPIREISFSTWKHEMFVNLYNFRHRLAVFHEETTSEEVARMEYQFLKLQKEVKNGKWSVHHPPGGHDDHPDALGLAVLSYSPLFQSTVTSTSLDDQLIRGQAMIYGSTPSMGSISGLVPANFGGGF